jgi:hypothetical protein
VDGKIMTKLSTAVVLGIDEETGAKLSIAVGHAADLVHEVGDTIEFRHGIV